MYSSTARITCRNSSSTEKVLMSLPSLAPCLLLTFSNFSHHYFIQQGNKGQLFFFLASFFFVLIRFYSNNTIGKENFHFPGFFFLSLKSVYVCIVLSYVWISLDAINYSIIVPRTLTAKRKYKPLHKAACQETRVF